MFDSLSSRLEGIVKRIRGKGRLTEADVDEVLKEIRTALLGQKFPNEGLIQLNETLWHDPHSAGVVNADYETTLSHRKHIEASTAEI